MYFFYPLRRLESLLVRVQNKIRRYRRHHFGPSQRPSLTVGRAYEAEWKEYECTFVLSTGRTGTQTLATLLDLSPALDAHHEPVPRLVQATYRAFQEANQSDWKERWVPFVRAVRDDHVLQSNKEGQTYVETANRLSCLAPALRKAFPASRFIFLHRDPYAVIRSSMERGAYQGSNKAWNFARIHPRSGEEYADAWETFTPYEKEAWRWARVNGDAIDFCNEVPSSRTMELPSADLFSAEADVLERLFSFLETDVPPRGQIENVLQKRLNAQAHFNGDTFNWTEEKKQAVRPLLRDVAEHLGYDL